MSAVAAKTSADEKLWVKCRPCGHVWIAVYLPQPMASAARALKNAYCPKCLERKQIFVAEAADIPPASS